MVPKILKPVRQKDIFRKKSYLTFKIKVPLCRGFPLSSDFIYNTNIINNDLMLDTLCFNRILQKENFEILTRIYEEAGQSIFRDTNEMASIPAKYLEPPIHISSYNFTADIGPITKQYMTMLSLHNPLNITFDSQVPLATFFNAKTLGDQWSKFLLFFSRVPIFVKFGDKKFIMNLKQIFDNQWIGLNSFFNKHDDLCEGIGTFRSFFKNARTNVYTLNDRNLYPEEKNNIFYDISYSDGRFHGVNSPQVNDWYLNRNDNLESSFNNVSAIKCILEINNLGAAFNETGNYTLGNAAIFINCTPQGDIKFTGKYFKKSPPKLNDTQTILEFCYNQFRNNVDIRNAINNEIGLDITGNFSEYIHNYEYLYESDFNPTYWIEDYSVKNLFLCLNGLEEWYRSNFALWLAGIYGHHWDFCLKYFSCRRDVSNLNKEAQTFKVTNKDFVFVQHLGSPLASYFLDFKQQPEVSILLGYNLGNMGTCISKGLISISDKISYNTTYKTRLKPVGLFPVVFQNINFYVVAKVWRSYRHLLTLMKTRQQRDIVMDHLNTYGRRVFTILDPYGIFLHFHNENRGLKPVDK